eukprot:517320-Prymnesium_polylepis.2
MALLNQRQAERNKHQAAHDHVAWRRVDLVVEGHEARLGHEADRPADRRAVAKQLELHLLPDWPARREICATANPARESSASRLIGARGAARAGSARCGGFGAAPGPQSHGRRSPCMASTVPSSASVWPSIFMRTSPSRTSSATGMSGATPTTSSPQRPSSSSDSSWRSARFSVFCTLSPSFGSWPKAPCASKVARKSEMTGIGMTYPMLSASSSPAKATPTTLPSWSKTGPPELPGLIAASICRTSNRSADACSTNV